MANQKYRDYFNIDENYFPCVNESAINSGLKWEDFYPHSTFIELIKKAERMLSRQEKRSLWISGAYGTGKSYAAYAMSNILSCSTSDLENYFNKYKVLEDYKTDLMQKLIALRTEGKIITGYRYASSDLHSSNDLIIALQSEISKIVEKNKLKYKGENTLKNNILKWLEEPHYNQLFTCLITNKYKDKFGGWTTENIMDSLRKNDTPLDLISKINKMATQENIGMLKIDMDGLIEYIKDIINQNNLKAIVFVLDEFSEFFQNNRHELTAFQKLVETCNEMPFYLVVVAHQMDTYFNEKEAVAKKIKDRFMSCSIEMPNNIAFDLMKDAMKIKEEAMESWDSINKDLIIRTTDARRVVHNSTDIADEVLREILPLHPFTAFLLKFISESFESNQRSMFDFIKNKDGSEAFQWFIDNHGPFDNDGMVLTVDLLWDFFYEKGKDNLATVIKNILDTYKKNENQGLMSDEKIVLKTVLIMQAVSTKLNDSIDLFIATEKNISLCFNGTDLENQAIGILNKLVRDEILYKKKTLKSEDWFVTAIMAGDMLELEKRKEEKIKTLKTNELIIEEFKNTFRLNSALKMRFKDIRFITNGNEMTRLTNELNDKDNNGQFYAVIGVAQNEFEASNLRTVMKQKATELKKNNIVFIDTMATPFGHDAISNYAEYIVSGELQQGKDGAAMRDFHNKANEVIKAWANRICSNNIILYSKGNVTGIRYDNFGNALLGLKEIVNNIYTTNFDYAEGLTESMFLISNLKLGSECGLTQSTKGLYGRQEKILNGAWGVTDYWKKNSLLNISVIKEKLDKKIKEELEENSKISIKDILMFLQSEFGFISSNLYAFITAFLLKEYANGSYRYSDDRINEKMSVDKMKEVLDEAFKELINPNTRYIEKYIRILSEQEALFCKLIGNIFDIPDNYCGSIEDTIRYSRIKVKDLGLPIWILKENADVLEIDFLDEFTKLLNSSEQNESAIANKIGAMVQNDSNINEKFKKIVTKENVENALLKYLECFESGYLLELRDELNIGTRIIQDIKEHFSNDSEGLWLWNVDTGNEEIKKVIGEYEFIKISNNILNTFTDKFSDTITKWQDKIKFIKISYELLSQTESNKMLQSISKHNCSKSNSLEFAKIVKEENQVLTEIVNSAKTIFKEKFHNNLNDLSDVDINNIYEKLPTDMFTLPRADYIEKVIKDIEEYRSNQKNIKLKKIWFDKTGTTTPRKWSDKYKTPILACIPNEDFAKYKRVFGTLNFSDPKETEIQFALEFLESNDELFVCLLDKEFIDKSFKDNILKQYKNVITDLNELREILINITGGIQPYDWYDNPSIPETIKKISVKKYKETTKNKVIAKIDTMQNEELKKYIKKLVEENINVGIEMLEDSED